MINENPEQNKMLTFELLIVYHELGITSHKNEGLINGFYRDIFEIGPFKLVIDINPEQVDLAPCPQTRRFTLVKEEIVKWQKELEKIYTIKNVVMT